MKSKTKAEIVSEYIAKAAKDGFSSPEHICKRAMEEVDIIDQELRKQQKLRSRRQELLEVLNYFGYSDLEHSVDDSTETARVLRSKIILMIESEGPKSNREIIKVLKEYDDGEIIRAVKWLTDKDVVARDSSSTENKIIKGNDWARFPELNKKATIGGA